MDDRIVAEGVPQLPDFSGGGAVAGSTGRPGGNGGAGGQGGTGGQGGAGGFGGGPGGSSDGSGGGRGRLLAVILGGAGCAAAVLAIVALVLSQTVVRTAPEEPTAGGTPSTSTSEDPAGTRPPEYVPTEEPTDPSAAETTRAPQPTVACTVHENEVVTDQADGVVRGGGLEFPMQEGWEVGTDWGSQGSYLTDQSFAHQPVENGWYAVNGVGAVEFTKEEGGYPGAQAAAQAIFQCGLTREPAGELFEDPPVLVDHQDHELTVDGHPAWVVSADVQLDELALFHTTDAWRIVVIVVETPDGPAAFDGGAALGHDQQVRDLEAMVEGLRVS